MERREQFDRYAIFQTGSKQYQAIEGQTIAIEKIEGEAGVHLTFNEVLLIKAGPGDYKIGQPFVEGAEIVASIVKQDKGPKLLSFRFKKRHKVRVKQGHRQEMTIIRIVKI